MNVITMGAHILDVLVRPVSAIPPEQGTVLVEQMRMTAAGTAAGTALTFAKLGAAVRTAGAIGTDPAGDLLLLDRAARIASASASHRRVEPSMSVNRNVTTPEGGSPADTRTGCHREPSRRGLKRRHCAREVRVAFRSVAKRALPPVEDAVDALVAGGLGSGHGDFDRAAADAFAAG